MNLLILAAAIINANASLVDQTPVMANWDKVLCMPVVEEGIVVDYRNPIVSVRTSLVGVGKFGTPCLRQTSSERFTVSESPFAFYSDFTIEGFVNFDQVTDTNQYIFDFGSNGFIVRFYGANGIAVFNGANAIISSNLTPTPGIWYHIAVVRFGSMLMLFIDGVLRGQTTHTTNLAYTTFTVGNYGGGGTYSMRGRIDQPRVTAEAIYTENFTPPQEPFVAGGYESPYDPYWSQTNLIIQDNAGAEMTITKGTYTLERVGGAVVNTAVVKIGAASMEMPPSSGGLFRIADNLTEFNFGSGMWSAECWVRPTLVDGGVQHVMGRRIAGQAGGWTFDLNNMRPRVMLSSNGSTWGTILGNVTGSALPVGRWSHLAVCRIGNMMYMFIGGELVDSVSYTGTLFDSTIPLSFGASNDASQPFTGLISGVRITKGAARYVSSFTPRMRAGYPTNGNVVPSANDPYFPKVVALFPFSKNVSNGPDMFQIVTQRAGVFVDTTRQLFGEPTMNISSGAGGGINYSNGSKTTLGAVNGTVEGWINTDYNQAALLPIIGQFHASSTGAWALGVSSGKLRWFIRGTVVDVSGTSNIADSQWHHVAVSIIGTTAYLYIDGVMEASVVMPSMPVYNGNIQVGYNIAAEATAGYRLNVARIRLTQGQARYTGNFIPDGNTVQMRSMAA